MVTKSHLCYQNFIFFFSLHIEDNFIVCYKIIYFIHAWSQIHIYQIFKILIRHPFYQFLFIPWLFCVFLCSSFIINFHSFSMCSFTVSQLLFRYTLGNTKVMAVLKENERKLFILHHVYVVIYGITYHECY